MSYTEGVQWVGGSETPPEMDSNDYLWWKWRTDSSKPCSICSSRNGISYPVKQRKPHEGCSCQQDEDWRWCEYKGRQSEGEPLIERPLEFIGNVPKDSFREFSDGSGSSLSGSFSSAGGSIGGGSSESDEDATRIYNNTNYDIAVFARWEIATTYFIDNWKCGVLNTPEQVIVTRIETTFVGYERSDSESFISEFITND